EGDKLKIAPGGVIAPDLKERLKERKPEIIQYLGELEASMKRLESQNILIAVNDDGDLRIVISEDQANRAIEDGYTIYTPRDMYYYVQLEPAERKMLREFKRRWNGSIEWRQQ